MAMPGKRPALLALALGALSPTLSAPSDAAGREPAPPHAASARKAPASSPPAPKATQAKAEAKANANANTDDAPIALRVGDIEFSAADIQRRLDALPAFQRAALGTTAQAIREHFVNDVLIPEALFASEAKRLALAKDPRTQNRLREVLRQALQARISEKLRTERRVTDAEIRAYYDAHLDRFRTPLRLRVWRIVVDDEKLAERILSEVRDNSTGPKRWRELAREHSLDQATRQRAGDLGFVRADGSTDVPRVKVDPRVFAAVADLADGKLIPKPLEREGRYSVLWRRGSVPASEQALDQVRERIAELLHQQRVERALNALLAGRRADAVRDKHPELLDHLPPLRFDDFRTRAREVSPPISSNDPTPKAVEVGYR